MNNQDNNQYQQVPQQPVYQPQQMPQQPVYQQQPMQQQTMQPVQPMQQVQPQVQPQMQQQPVQQEEVKFCNNCGAKLPTNKRCLHCGMDNNQLNKDEQVMNEIKKENKKIGSGNGPMKVIDAILDIFGALAFISSFKLIGLILVIVAAASSKSGLGKVLGAILRVYGIIYLIIVIIGNVL